MNKKHVVIFRCWLRRLKTLRELQKGAKDVEITLVDRNNYHYEATDLHEVAAGTQPAEKSHTILWMLSMKNDHLYPRNS